MTRSSPLRLAGLIALLCAVSLRLLAPPGWMPNLDGHGGAPLVICTGDGIRTVQAPPDPASHHRDKAGHEICAFAGLAFGAAAQGEAIQPAAALAQALDRPLRSHQAPPALAWRRPQAARAPPLMV